MKAALYCRVSTVDGKQDYNRQIMELTELAKAHGYTDSQIEVFAEKASGYKTDEERPEIGRLLKIVNESPKYFNRVYCLEISRIARKGKYIRDIIDKLKAQKIPLYIKNLGLKTLEDDGTESIATNIIVAVFSEIADEYARSFKANSKSGLMKAAKDGKAGGSTNLPYGYKKNAKGYLIIDEEEAVVIHQIFNLYKAGHGVKVISGILNQQGIPTRYNKTHGNRIANQKTEKHGSAINWKDGTVLSILTNTLYKGDRRFKDIVIKAPAIISSELFDECQEIRLGKTHKNHLTKYTFLLKDLMVCGCCARNYFAKYKPVEGGDRVYICSSRLLPKGNCGNVGVNINLLESALYNQIVNKDSIIRYLKDTSELTTKLKLEIDTLETTIKICISSLKDKNAESEKLIDLFQTDGIRSKERFLERNEKIENDIDNIEIRLNQAKLELAKKKAALKSFSTTKASKEMLVAAKDNRSELQAIFRRFVHRVTITNTDDNNAIANVSFKINDVIIENPLLVKLDLSGIRKKPMVYRYKELYIADYDNPFFAGDEFDYLDWEIIDQENIITVEP